VLALNNGARQGKLLRLRYEDVGLDRSLIYFGSTKNRKLKTIPMNKSVKGVMAWFLNHRYSQYLFGWPWGKQIGRTTINDAFKKACREAKIEEMRFHDLPHTAASYPVTGGVDLATVREILGHRIIEMTLRYFHLAPAHKAKAVEKLGVALNNAVQDRLFGLEVLMLSSISLNAFRVAVFKSLFCSSVPVDLTCSHNIS